jgi:hypothetical protein
MPVSIKDRVDCPPPTTSIDYVLTHMGYTGPSKPSSFDGCWVERYLTSLHGRLEGIVFGPPTDYRVRFFHGWWHYGKVGPSPYSLIVIAKGGHLCCLRGSHASYCKVIFPCKVTIDSNLHDILGYGWSLFSEFKHTTWGDVTVALRIVGWCWLLCSRSRMLYHILHELPWMFSIGCQSIYC